MEQNQSFRSEMRELEKEEKRSFSIGSILKKEGRWKVLGITVEAWVFAFLVALALPYINIVAIPVMFFVFAGALAVYSIWVLFRYLQGVT